MLIDTHAHLTDNQYRDDLERVLTSAIERGIGAIIDVADSPSSSRLAADYET